MEREKLGKRFRKYIKSYFTLPSLVGGALGTAVGYWSSLTAIGVYELLSKLPYTIQSGDISYLFLYSNSWEQAGKIAFAGGVAGLLLARRIEIAMFSFLRKIFGR